MTEQEKQLITQLADRIRTAPPPQIDRDANDLINRSVGSRPDALYILTQTVIIQQMALDQAKAQIEQLQRQQASQPTSQQGGFLPGSQPAPESRYPSGGYSNSPYSGQTYEAPPAPAPGPPQGSRFSDFLHNAATTAAGVIAGNLAFDALASIFGHHSGYYGGGGGFLSGGIMPGSETIINNYYGDDRPFDQSGDSGHSRFADVASQNQGLSPDIEDDRDNSRDAFAAADDSAGSGDDSGDSDDNYTDDGSDDDDSSFDSGDDNSSSDF